MNSQTITQKPKPPQARRTDYRDLALEHYAAIRADDADFRERLIAEMCDLVNDRDIAVGLASDAIKDAIKSRRQLAAERQLRKKVEKEYAAFRVAMLGGNGAPWTPSLVSRGVSSITAPPTRPQ